MLVLSRKTKRILLISLGSVPAMLLAFYFFWNTYDFFQQKEEKKVSYKLSPQAKELIRDGDIILRYGFGLPSDYIVTFFDEPYKISHCGIITRRGDSLQVIHSESSSYFSFEGTILQDFDSYVDASHKNSVIIVRFKADSSRLHRIAKRGMYYYHKHIPFDYDFDLSDSSEMYCAEIIWHVLRDEFQTDIYHFPGKEFNHKQFANFYDTLYFQTIFNHQDSTEVE